MLSNYETSARQSEKGLERSSYADIKAVGPMKRLPRQAKRDGNPGWDEIAAEAAAANG